MAGKDRSTTPDVMQAALHAAPYRHGFFSTVRRLECLNLDKPRIGRAARPADEPLRFGQEPSLAFAPTELAAYEPAHGSEPARLYCHFFGLFGPNGPLPHHLTEYARDRLRNAHDPTFSRFLDIFHHRMFTLFYRAWADAEPAVSLDRPASDRFARYLGSLFGQGRWALEQRDALSPRAKLAYAGVLSGLSRQPDGLRAMLEDYFGLPARIVEFVGQWMELPAEDRWRLGVSGAGTVLGETSVLGAQVWGRQQKFRIELGPMDLHRYISFLPGGRELPALTAMVRNYTGDALAWDVRLRLQARRVPGFHLDGARQMGWTTWLGRRSARHPAGDLLLEPMRPRAAYGPRSGRPDHHEDQRHG